MKKRKNKDLVTRILAITLMICISLINEQVSAKDIKSNSPTPFLELSFDETDGNIAHNSGSSGERLNAQVNGGTITWVPGLFKGASQFSNNGYFKLPDGIMENITNFTLSVWVYINDQVSNQTVCTFANGTEQYLILTTQRGNEENGVSLVMTKKHSDQEGHTNKEERIAYTKQKDKLSANAWHHLAFTLEGNTGILYVDGVKAEVKNDFTTNPSVLGHTTDNYIGKPTWPDPYFNGMMDDFKIYDCALTEKQILELSSAADPLLVQDDKDKLSLSDLSAVTSDILLPVVGESGSKISWSSNKTEYISNQGIIHRPDAGSGDKKIILTATLQKGKTLLKKNFTATIKDISTAPEDLNVFSMQTGNPTVPAYLADASFYYDPKTDLFYAYGTNDGAGGGNVYPTQVWYSKDCKTWKNEPITFPKSWTDYAGTTAVWAPSIEYNPDTRKYYLMYSIASHTFVGMSDHPLGPWEDANSIAPGKMLFQGYDGQFFIDDDHTMYITTDSWHFKIMKLKFDKAGKIYIDNEDPKYEQTASNKFIGTYKYHQVDEIKNAFEASYIYKKNDLYYLMWSFNGSENYNVRYAVSEHITGPYREINQSMTTPILQRDDTNQILGPGHHSMFDYNGRTFIAYHRQHYPFVDSKRQTRIEEVFFNTDGSIQKIKPTHKGVTVVNTEKDSHKNIALGKQTKVSSAREYDSSAFSGRYRTNDISFRYSGNFAVDENYGTHWDAGIDVKNPWIIVDLGSNCRIDEIETIFEFTSRTYKYKIEYLQQEEASNLDIASESKAWKVFVDRTMNGVPQSPVIDTLPNKSSVQGRFVRLTILDGINIPETADGIDLINAKNALSIFELKVFGEEKADDINRTFEAENFHNLYGLTLEKCTPDGLDICKGGNNDYLLYENINLGNGADIFSAKVASETKGGQLEIYLDSMLNKPIGVLEVKNTGGEQKWTIQSTGLSKNAKGFHKKLYLVFKGKEQEDNLFKLDWFRFEKSSNLK